MKLNEGTRIQEEQMKPDWLRWHLRGSVGTTDLHETECEKTR